MNKKSKKGKFLTFEDFILLLLAIVCIGISTYQTALGYEAAAGAKELAWILAGIISVGLGVLNYNLRNSFKSRLWNRFLTVISIYLIFATFSVMANFNAFYSQYMKEKLLDEEANDFKIKLTSLNQKTITAFDDLNTVDELKIKAEELKVTLRLQILDPGLPGLGTKARKELNKIEALLGQKLTEPAGSPEQIWTSYRRQIDDIIDERERLITQDPKQFKRELNAATSSAIAQLDSALITSDNLIDDRLAINKARDVYNAWGKRAEVKINDKSLFQFQEESVSSYGMGTIRHSIMSARKKGNAEGALVALALSMLIDLFVPIMILLLTTQVEQKPKQISKRNNSSGYFPRRSKSQIPKKPNSIKTSLTDKVDSQ